MTQFNVFWAISVYNRFVVLYIVHRTACFLRTVHHDDDDDDNIILPKTLDFAEDIILSQMMNQYRIEICDPDDYSSSK